MTTDQEADGYISDYLRLVPRTLEAARAGQKPQFAPSRLAEYEPPIPRVRPDRRYIDLEASPGLESWAQIAARWAQLLAETVIFVAIIGGIIWWMTRP